MQGPGTSAAEPRDLDPGLKRIGDKAILRAKAEPLDAQDPRRLLRLGRAYAPLGELGRLAVREVDQQDALASVAELRKRATHLRLGVIRMRGDDHCVVLHQASFGRRRQYHRYSHHRSKASLPSDHQGAGFAKRMLRGDA